MCELIRTQHRKVKTMMWKANKHFKISAKTALEARDWPSYERALFWRRKNVEAFLILRVWRKAYKGIQFTAQ